MCTGEPINRGASPAYARSCRKKIKPFYVVPEGVEKAPEWWNGKSPKNTVTGCRVQAYDKDTYYNNNKRSYDRKRNRKNKRR